MSFGPSCPSGRHHRCDLNTYELRLILIFLASLVKKIRVYITGEGIRRTCPACWVQRRRCRCVRSGRRRARRGYIQRRPRHRSARSTVDNALRWRREPPCYANVTERSDTAAVVLRTGKENGGASLVSSVARDTAGWVGRGQTAPVVKCAEWRGSAVGLAIVRVGAGSPSRAPFTPRFQRGSQLAWRQKRRMCR